MRNYSDRVPNLSDIVTFAIASLALLVIPGPAVIYVLNRSVADGRNTALAGVAGLEIGNFMHVIAATLGLSAIIAASATAFSTVKWAGALYLVFVGIRTLLSKPTPPDARSTSATARKAFTQGIIVNTLNPKVALFFLSYLPQFIDPDRGSPALQSFVLGSIFVALGCCSDATYALTASALRDRLLTGRALPFVQRYVAGSVFVALGVVASTARRS
ncbi:MAG: LysE family translocator [Actinobacteria bacterium]|jgi:threonine/homoserine/homoserine lactone efflux protein|nr:LysE family translocator [Actinomycetota bacterium]NBY12851.1 LysE family translocator [Actinomycetota bacterium]NCZ91647.1 LysE family translocator [Actinomycetota bacterium]NDC45241.1 LysE family translocator [Actinomycetota bacterium]NDD86694.1 LysE family translocator [Actinomycetota bacterium]